VLRPGCVSLRPFGSLPVLARGVGAIATMRPQLNILQLVLTGCPLCRNQTRHRPTIIGNRVVSLEPNYQLMSSQCWRQLSGDAGVLFVHRNVCPSKLHISPWITDWQMTAVNEAFFAFKMVRHATQLPWYLRNIESLRKNYFNRVLLFSLCFMKRI
jgi:hypothetical protein